MKRALLLLALAACTDPVRTDAENAVPGDGKRNGPEHHVGYQCTACHTSGVINGPPEFSFGGTVFKYRDDPKPLEQRGLAGAKVIIVDRNGVQYPPLVTNSVGNFYAHRSELDPPFPVTVYVRGPNDDDYYLDQLGTVVNQMRSHIGREGGCGFCHKLGLRNDPFNVPEIYFARTAAELQKAGIQP